MVPRSRHPLLRVVPSSLVSPIVTGTFPFSMKFARTSSLEIKRVFPSLTSSLKYNPEQLPWEAKAVFEWVLGLSRGVWKHGVNTLSCVEKDQLILGSALPVEGDMFTPAELGADREIDELLKNK